jgi:hypothetical protein
MSDFEQSTLDLDGNENTPLDDKDGLIPDFLNKKEQ